MKWVVIAALVVLSACGAEKAKTPADAAAPEAARAITDPVVVVRGLYDRYATPPEQFPALEDEPWTQDMRGQIVAMNARSQALNEPILDFDPFTNAQDGAVSGLTVTADGIVEASHAVVRAQFTVDGRPTVILYDLRWENEAWRIDNVRNACWDLCQIAGAANAGAIVVADTPECRGG